MPMIGVENAALGPCLFGLLALGMASACAARVSVGSCWQFLCQLVFTVCLLLVGLVTALTLTLSPNFWVVPAATFSLMLLMATCDFGRSRQAAAW